jgi:hypothetical protein
MSNLKYSDQFNNAPYNLFCLPSVSRALHESGLTNKVILWWDLIKDGSIESYNLRTFFWDYDAYYVASQSIIDSVNKGIKIPAYSITDIEQLLPPDYLFQKQGTDFTISIDKIWGAPAVTSKRMADCYGAMLLQLIIQRSVSIEELNKNLEKSIIQNSAG